MIGAVPARTEARDPDPAGGGPFESREHPLPIWQHNPPQTGSQQCDTRRHLAPIRPDLIGLLEHFRQETTVESRADRTGDRHIRALHRPSAPLDLDGKLWSVKLAMKETAAGFTIIA